MNWTPILMMAIVITRLVNANPEQIAIRIKKECASYETTKPINPSQKVENYNANGDVEISLKLIVNNANQGLKIKYKFKMIV